MYYFIFKCNLCTFNVTILFTFILFKTIYILYILFLQNTFLLEFKGISIHYKINNVN